MNSYDIYMEGYQASGDSAPARYVGHAYGDTFEQACRIYYSDSYYYNESRNTYWGCRLFESLEEAQRSFG